MLHPEGEEFADDAFGVVFFSGERGAEVEILVEEVFALLALGFDCGAEGGEAFAVMADIVEGANFRFLQTRLACS